MINIIKKIFGYKSLSEKIEKVFDLEKSIQENKDVAIREAKIFLPIINKLNGKDKTINEICKSKSATDEDVFLQKRIKAKLDRAKIDYYSKIGQLAKLNKGFKNDLDKLISNQKVKDGVELIKAEKAFKNPLSIVLEAYRQNKISKDLLLKAVKSAKDKKVFKVMGEFKEGSLKSSSGKKVTDKKQAMAIAMSEADKDELKKEAKEEKQKPEEKEETKDKGNNKEEKKENKTSLEEKAKEQTGEVLENAATEAEDSKVREAAHNELDRRKKEEHVQEEGKEAQTTGENETLLKQLFPKIKEYIDKTFGNKKEEKPQDKKKEKEEGKNDKQ